MLNFTNTVQPCVLPRFFKGKAVRNNSSPTIEYSSCLFRKSQIMHTFKLTQIISFLLTGVK